MQIIKPGRYRLTEQWSVRGTLSIQHFAPSTVIEIDQVNGNRVIGPQLLDWTDSEIPAEEIEGEK